ncbi:DUF58 domain-containing protein [Kribbella sp. VKM Ac-2568]|uniref:DUF58 domain-containing protein n=1 Tax=Kribbella sp. VKM Ac-2568 TaxID=2512219 RepID=UPI00104EF200|nr:DUF58 domain-containing protein [Kribbella sp. VKM Ac-2568]TCM37809.1 uncharacterized protein (DUF58 family) [Kribbella sp. VKM Ac-2568]
MVVTGRAALLAALGVVFVAMLTPSWGGVGLVVAAVLLVCVVDLLLAGSPRRLQLSREGDTAVRLGERAVVTMLVANPSRRVKGLLRDAWPPSAGVQDPPHKIDLPNGDRRRFVTHLIPTRRGDRHAYRVTIRSIGPLGFAGRQGSHRVPWTVRALPPFNSRKHLPSRLARLRELDGRTALLVRGQGTEFDSLRDYVPGDDVRSIDWRATARRGNVVLRTWRPERDRQVAIVIDSGRMSAGRVGDAPRLDHAMDAALLLAALATRAGDRVSLLACDSEVRADVRRPAPEDVLPSFVNALANVDAELVQTDFRVVVSQVLERLGQRSLVVLLTGLDPAVIEESLLPVIGPLLRRHVVVLASVADPRLAEMELERSDLIEVYGAASAARTRLDRERVTAVLTRAGVTVVDEAPDQIAPALADTYLALKKAGRL